MAAQGLCPRPEAILLLDNFKIVFSHQHVRPVEAQGVGEKGPLLCAILVVQGQHGQKEKDGQGHDVRNGALGDKALFPKPGLHRHKPFVKDIKAAVESEEFLSVVTNPKTQFSSFQRPEWVVARLAHKQYDKK